MQDRQQSWDSLWRSLRAERADPTLLAALLQRYSEPQRKYHTLQHLNACLAHFETVRTQTLHPDEVELALWFHDAIYDIGASDNEARSADWARTALNSAGGDAQAAQRVYDLVLVTRHDVAPQTLDQQVLLDVDLSILGASPRIFDAYEQQIRAEYAGVQENAFRSRRRRILQLFLDRPRIYHTTQFHGQFESQARDNLARSIRQLAD